MVGGQLDISPGVGEPSHSTFCYRGVKELARCKHLCPLAVRCNKRVVRELDGMTARAVARRRQHGGGGGGGDGGGGRGGRSAHI